MTRPPAGTYCCSRDHIYPTVWSLVDSVVPNSGPWSLLGRSVSYIIKLAPILWWALPASLAAPHPEPPNASTYNWLPDNLPLTPFLQTTEIPNIVFQRLHSAEIGNFAGLRQENTNLWIQSTKSKFTQVGYPHIL
ncbi:hypothetical protein DSO57_1007772 [Entomophthora muscae]|uniref:Uncharacterized protein n=1 Tax=Entomophthora muscae TaxID=34485 RepID=A0ACC2UT00_9FUNG|nr:hypothetical protein DSO57_1007772 [Entomophthora muscae]